MKVGKLYYIPKFKWELVEFLSRIYPEDKWKFNKMRKKRLYAIYYNIREKEVI